MAVKWIKCKTPGVRYYEHVSRKHGVRLDRYFSIRYKLEGKDKEEGLGWASQGWSESKAMARLAEIRENIRTGKGPQSLHEMRVKEKTRRNALAKVQADRAREAVTFSESFNETYFPQAKEDKSDRSWKKEEQCHRLWIAPVIGTKPLKDVSPFDLERIKKAMAEAGRAPRSTFYCLAVVRQVFNHARRHNLYSGDNPVSKIKKPSEDNRRLRFLTHEEAEALLEALGEVSPNLQDMALLALHCGLRVGEIFTLTWGDVDLDRGVLSLRDTKSGKNRPALLTEGARAMFRGRLRGAPQELVFPARGGGRGKQVSKAFERVVDQLGLNLGVTDRRLKVVFHTLRHTYASWLVERGVDLYTVKELMGHSAINMTERYSHLAPDSLRRAVRELEASMEERGKKVVNLRPGTRGKK